MTKTATDTMNAILAAATALPDRLLVPPSATKGRALKALADELVAAGFAKEIEAQVRACLAARPRDEDRLRAEADGRREESWRCGRSLGPGGERRLPRQSLAPECERQTNGCVS